VLLPSHEHQARYPQSWRFAVLIEALHGVPRFLRRLDPGQQVEVRRRDHAFVGQRLEIHHPRPELAPEQQHRDRLHLAGLDQRQQFEHLVERAEAAGKYGQRPCPKQEMHLAQGKIMELEAQFRRDEAVGRLLMGQDDVHADGGGAHIVGAAIGRLHDRGAAARTDDEMAASRFVHRILRRDPRQLARLVIIARLSTQIFRDALLFGRGRGVDARLHLLRFGDARRSVEDEGRFDLRLVHQQLRLQQFELEPHRPQILPQQEFGVLEGQAIGGAAGLRCFHPLAGVGGFLTGGAEFAFFDFFSGHFHQGRRPR